MITDHFSALRNRIKGIYERIRIQFRLITFAGNYQKILFTKMNVRFQWKVDFKIQYTIIR